MYGVKPILDHSSRFNKPDQSLSGLWYDSAWTMYETDNCEYLTGLT
jgi:hypothetical protein